MSNFVFIKKEYFNDNPDFVEMLDPFNLDKQASRHYMYLNIKYLGNNILIPLRKNAPRDRALGFPTPTESRPNAGLDYRKMLIVNDEQYIEFPTSNRLSNRQTNIIDENYDIIESAVIHYIEGYIKSARKNREHRDNKYVFSTLHNFHKELCIN